MKVKRNDSLELLVPIAINKFVDIMDPYIGAAIDDYFQKQGWELQLIEEDGYQVFFGEGVQVDNHDEYGFPHLYGLDDLIPWAYDFHMRIIKGIRRKGF